MTKIKLCLVTFGIIIGIVGILHGSAELLKGSVLVESHSAEALPENWPNEEFYTVMAGSPVFSLLTGIPHLCVRDFSHFDFYSINSFFSNTPSS